MPGSRASGRAFVPASRRSMRTIPTSPPGWHGWRRVRTCSAAWSGWRGVSISRLEAGWEARGPMTGLLQEGIVAAAALAARRELLGEIVEDLGAVLGLDRRHAVLFQHQVEGRVPEIARQTLRLDQRHTV